MNYFILTAALVVIGCKSGLTPKTLSEINTGTPNCAMATRYAEVGNLGINANKVGNKVRVGVEDFVPQKTGDDLVNDFETDFYFKTVGKSVDIEIAVVKRAFRPAKTNYYFSDVFYVSMLKAFSLVKKSKKALTFPKKLPLAIKHHTIENPGVVTSVKNRFPNNYQWASNQQGYTYRHKIDITKPKDKQFFDEILLSDNGKATQRILTDFNGVQSGNYSITGMSVELVAPPVSILNQKPLIHITFEISPPAL